MNIAPRRARFLSAVTAFLVVAGLTGAALAQDFGGSRAAEAGHTETVSHSFSPDAAKPVTPAGKLAEVKAALAIISDPPKESHASSELIHQAIFSSAGVVEKGSRSIGLIGIEATAIDAQCGSGPDVWPCGRVARAALQRFVRRRVVECRAPDGEPADGMAHCTVGGRDIGEWLVAQGWARAQGPDYADAEKIAREEKRGVWSPVRPGLAPEPVFELGPMLTNPAVRAEVDLSNQSMTLVHRGRIVGQWPVSTARVGKETPIGMWTAKWLARDHRSSLYNNAPMPYSVFYDGDYAVHGTYQTDRLGRPASAGCVRLDTEHAAVLFNLVRKEGLSNTLIEIRR